MRARRSPRAWLLRALALWWTLALTVAPAAAQAEPARRIYVGVYLRDLTRLDQRNGTYDVDVELWLKWLGEFDPALVRVANESDLHRDDLGEADDGGWHVHRWRLRGTLRGEFPLQRFPFDDQRVSIDFELPERDGVLTPDLTGSGMETRFSITGWNYEPHFAPRVERLIYRSDLGSVEQEGRPTTVQRSRFAVTLRRPTVTIALKLFLPLGLILLVALVALFLGPEQLEARSSIGVTALLACFAFQFTVAGTIPEVSYLTVADSFFILAYAVTALALLTTVTVHWFHRTERHRGARRLDVASRLFNPLLIAVVAWALVRAPAQPPPPAPPLPAMERRASARPLLRVGLTQLPSLMNGFFTSATRWSLVQPQPDGTRLAFLAEQAPSVGNDATRLLPNGDFEVRWRLREGARWSDGHALTSDDVRFALEVSPDPRVTSLSTPDARTVILTYSGSYADALDGPSPLPRHALGEIFRQGGLDAVSDTRRSTIVPGTGPYRVRSFERERSAVLEANPFFLGPAPNIARVELRCIADGDALAAAFERGELDMLAPSALSPAQIDAVAQAHPGQVLQRLSNQLYALQADPNIPWLQSREVRRALLRALDRRALATGVFGASSVVAHAPTTEPLPAGITLTGYDRDAAAAALAQEGAAGQTLRLTHLNGPNERRMVGYLRDAWTAVGLTVQTTEVNTLVNLTRDRNHGGLLLYSVSADRDGEMRRYWNLPRAGGRIVTSARTEAYDNAAADLADREERALFPERRAQLRGRLFVLFSERVPVLPLAFASERYLVAPTLRGWDRGPGVRFGEGLEQWRFIDPNAPVNAPTGSGPLLGDGGVGDAGAGDGGRADGSLADAQPDSFTDATALADSAEAEAPAREHRRRHHSSE